MKLSDKMYDTLKFVAQYLIPGLSTLYFTLGGIWGLPYVEQIIGTLAAIDTFLAFVLGLSKAKYEGDGILNIDFSYPSPS